MNKKDADIKRGIFTLLAILNPVGAKRAYFGAALSLYFFMPKKWAMWIAYHWPEKWLPEVPRYMLDGTGEI